MKIYCQNCGKPTEYSAMNKPNFCFNCGGAFSEGGASNATQLVKQEAPTRVSDGLEDEDEVTSIPNISKLEVEIDVEKAASATMQSLIGTAQEGVVEPPRGSSGLSDEELVRSVLKEGRALKGKQIPDKDA